MVGKVPFRRTGDWKAFEPKRVAQSPLFSRAPVVVRSAGDGRQDWTRLNDGVLQQIVRTRNGQVLETFDPRRGLVVRYRVDAQATARARNALQLREWQRRTPGGIYL